MGDRLKACVLAKCEQLDTLNIECDANYDTNRIDLECLKMFKKFHSDANGVINFSDKLL